MNFFYQSRREIFISAPNKKSADAFEIWKCEPIGYVAPAEIGRITERISHCRKKIKWNTRHRNFLESTFFGSGRVWRNCVWIESSRISESHVHMYLYVTLYISRGRRISVIASSCGHLIFHSSSRIKIRARPTDLCFISRQLRRARASVHARNNYRAICPPRL